MPSAAGIKAPGSKGVQNFFANFDSERACLEHVFEARWGSHTPCPSCGELGHWAPIKGKKQWLHSCRRHISPLQHTAMYRSNLSLMAWFYAMRLFADSSHGMRSSFIRKQLGLGHNSSVRLCKNIRMHMASLPRPKMLGGPGKLVNIDEVYLKYIIDPIGSQRKAMIVLGIACEDDIICGIIPNRRKSTILNHIQLRVRPGSTIVTDEHKSYHDLPSLGFKHISINHSVTFHNFDGVDNNQIETFWAVLRRNLRAYRQVSEDYLWMYLAEIEFRYRRRKRKHEIFEDMISEFPEIRIENLPEIRSRFDWRDL